MGGGGKLFGGGGGGGGGGNLGPRPDAPKPIDYEAMYSAARKYGNLMLGDQTQAMMNLYPQMINQQLGTALVLSRNLDTPMMQNARQAIVEEFGVANTPSQIEAALGQQAINDLRAGPTAIQRKLQSDAEQELSLGRSLSAEEQRDAQQAARSAFAARGLGTSAGSSAAEILNRDSMGRQREQQRRQFASGIDEYVLGQQANRRNFATQANQLDIDRRQRRVGLAGAYADTDMYRQGLNAAFQLGGSSLDRSMNLGAGAFNNSLQTAGNVETFNRNMQASQFNSWMNNNAAVQAANAQSGAMGQSGMMGMMGGIGGGLLTGVGLAL